MINRISKVLGKRSLEEDEIALKFQNSTTLTSPISLLNENERKCTLSFNQHSAVECVVCKNKSPPSAVSLPFLYMGRTQEYMICKKSHLSTEEDYRTLIIELEAAYNHVKKTKDEPISFLRSAQNGVFVPSSAEDTMTCAGIVDGEDGNSKVYSYLIVNCRCVETPAM